MAINGSGVRDTGRVLGISPTTVINELKKVGRYRSCQLSITRATGSRGSGCRSLSS
ncbi:IS1-like element transposase [Pseudanabaena sp. FACHB-1998]|uniref:IS1-like element transposase n=1 Tax=Pseudanabaena sp. FACHB-1998 TaxID=2692858 RepID=UPI00322091B4